MLKAIETPFDGYWFRSRLEARWATFFKTLGVKYEYEKEGYDLDGTWYLPDFWLPEQECWIEIKGQIPTKEEGQKAALLAMSTNHPVYIFHGSIWVPGVDDTEEVEKYDGALIETEQKGATCYSPKEATMVGRDTTSPCYKEGCVHTSPDGYVDGCPYCHILSNRGIEGVLARMLYIAGINYSHGDSCRLRLTPDGKLQFVRPEFSRDGEKEEELPIPACIQAYDDEYVAFFRRFSSDWEWRIGGVGDILYPLTVNRWCQCSFCFKGGITPNGEEQYLPCHREHKKKKKGDYWPLPEMDRTERLMKAYTAARQARFEQGR
jgi:hypothetical protein